MTKLSGMFARRGFRLCASLLLAATLNAVGDVAKSNKAEEKPLTAPGQGVQVTATLRDSSFSDGPVSGPAFAITLTIRNFRAQPVTLGETLVVLEQERGSANFIACYQSRAREEATPRLQRLRERYQLDWGEEIDKDGASLLTFVGGGSFSVTFSHPGTYEGLGFGQVSPQAERTIEIELPFPYKLKGERELLALIAPTVRPAGAAAGPPIETILRFEPKPPAKREPYRLTATTTLHLRDADLRERLSEPALPSWEHLAVLNWLAETAPKTAEPLLLEAAAQKDAPAPLRAGAIYALGTLKSAAAVPRLIEMTSSEAAVPLRRASLIAVGDIGDLAAAPTVRGLFSASNDAIVSAAVEAAGKLKDPDAVAPLAALFRNPKKSYGADKALAAIATPAAKEALIAALQDRSDDVRRAATTRLGETGWPEATPALVAVVRNAKTKDDERANAVSALGKLGGTESLAAIKESLSDSNERLYKAALAAMDKLATADTDAAALTALSSRHSAIRREGAEMVGKRKPAGAVAALWIAYQKETDESPGQRMAETLAELKFSDPSAVAWLLPRLDQKKNKLWYSDIELLKHLTGQDYGPEHRWANNKERDIAIAKWVEWGRQHQ